MTTVLMIAAALNVGGEAEWVEPTAETRPWAVCHLMGNAVEKAELAKEMRRWSEAGLGGVRLVPIYAAKGSKGRNIATMSPEFVSLLKDANALAGANGLKVDLSFGAGWCFGGRTIPDELGCQNLKALKPGEPAPKGAKLLFEKDGTRLVSYFPGQRVKRAQTIDSGPMMNPFSTAAMTAHLNLFRNLDGVPSAYPRAAFHDSFEYECNWSDELPALFLRHRGYRIEDHYAELAGIGDADSVARVKQDYRETLSDILSKDVFPIWTQWCHKRGIIVHNQAHGAPADLLAFYAIADTPESEMFGRGTRDKFKSRFDGNFRDGARDMLFSKFASSAAHLVGRKYVSAEAFTWMAEHFCETPEEMKAFGDLLFLSGVNRLYFHATPYSPDSAPWPGWCFYASSQITPRNPLWRDMGRLNEYFTRVQSLLADAQPDNDVLLYWPIHDLWGDPDGFQTRLSVRSGWMAPTEFGRLAKRLHDAGYSFDYISDPFLSEENVSRYRAIVVPKTKFMKKATLEKLKDFSRRLPVIFERSLPESTPGLPSTLNPQISTLNSQLSPVADAVAELANTGVMRDGFAASDTPFDALRMSWRGGRLYFIVNSSTNNATLSLPDGAVAMNPMTGARETASAENGVCVTWTLPPAHSMFAFLKSGQVRQEKVPQTQPTATVTVDSGWTLEFVRDVSGWELPPKRSGAKPGDWTVLGAREEEFSGTARYSTCVKLENGFAEKGGRAILDLGEVCNSARVTVNGKCAGTLFMHPYRLEIPAGLLKDGENALEIEVTNLGANRIRAMDRKGVEWKNFEDINMVGIDYKPLDASGWPIQPSGLIGPVKIELRD